MRLVQKKEETPSLSLWLSRDVPHERELARELTEQMGREKSLEYLLHLHDAEETRRQKRIVVSNTIYLCFAAIVIPLSILTIYFTSLPRSLRPEWSQFCVALMLLCTLPFHINNYLLKRNMQKKTPWYSSLLQQRIITALLDYADNPLAADALARALVYYTGDRNRLYERLAHLLPLLPDAPDALTKQSRRALGFYLLPVTTQNVPETTENLPVLRAAIADYFARTEPLVKGHFQGGILAFWSKIPPKESDR